MDLRLEGAGWYWGTAGESGHPIASTDNRIRIAGMSMHMTTRRMADDEDLEIDDGRGRDVHSRSVRVRSELRLRTAGVTSRTAGRPPLGAEGNSECRPRRPGTARRLMARSTECVRNHGTQSGPAPDRLPGHPHHSGLGRGRTVHRGHDRGDRGGAAVLAPRLAWIQQHRPPL